MIIETTNSTAKDLIWSKTLLSVYRYLPRITGALDKIFEAKVMNGNNMSGSNSSRNNVVTLTNTLINLIGRKSTLINLKLVVEKVLLAIDRDSARLLVKKYFDNLTSEEIAKKLGCSRRTYFRKLNVALTSFRKLLAFFGYDRIKLDDWLKSEKWITEVFKKLENSTEEETSDVLNETIVTSICSRMNKLCMA